MNLNENAFTQFLEGGINRHLSQLSQKEKDLVRNKGKFLFDLIDELNNKNKLTILTNVDIQDIRSKHENVMKIFDEIKNLYLFGIN